MMKCRCPKCRKPLRIWFPTREIQANIRKRCQLCKRESSLEEWRKTIR